MARLTLRGRLLLGFIVVLTLPSISAVIAYLGALDVREHTRVLAESHYPILEVVSRAEARVTVLQAALDRACQSNDLAALDHARSLAQALDRELAALEGLVSSAASTELRATASVWARDAAAHCAVALDGGMRSEAGRDEIERDAHVAARLHGQLLSRYRYLSFMERNVDNNATKIKRTPTHARQYKFPSMFHCLLQVVFGTDYTLRG